MTVTGRRLTVDDANGHSRTWVYDDAGDLLSFEVDGVRQLTQAFDAAARVTSRAIGAQGATTYAYDGDGRLASVDAPDAAPVQYAYTAAGFVGVGHGCAWGPRTTRMTRGRG